MASDYTATPYFLAYIAAAAAATWRHHAKCVQCSDWNFPHFLDTVSLNTALANEPQYAICDQQQSCHRL